MNAAVQDEPEQIEEPDEDRQQQHYNEMYARRYENEHTWEELQEDEFGNLRMVCHSSTMTPKVAKVTPAWWHDVHALLPM